VEAGFIATTWPTTSQSKSIRIAAKACFREAIRRANPVLLEPIMKVEVVTP
jgi:elongation factor G